MRTGDWRRRRGGPMRWSQPAGLRRPPPPSLSARHRAPSAAGRAGGSRSTAPAAPAPECRGRPRRPAARYRSGEWLAAARLPHRMFATDPCDHNVSNSLSFQLALRGASLMPPRKKTTPRKRPTQERAVFTVNAILEAATYILVKEGWGAFTTNRAAERAGVNIASLYQYFPNKESIVVERQRRQIERAREEFPKALPALKAQRSLRGLLRVIVDAGVREHRLAPALHRVFAEELPRSARRHDPADESHEIRQWKTLTRPFFRNVPDLDMALFLCRAAAHAAIHEAAYERPDLLDNPLFVDELTTL